MNKDKLAHMLKELQGNETQRWLARQMKVSPYSLNGWVNASIEPNLESLQKIADYTGESLDALLNRLGVATNQTTSNFPTNADGLIAYINDHLSRAERLKLLRLIVLQDC
jgi:transcriptional regulator with XRE-family HTH domain